MSRDDYEAAYRMRLAAKRRADAEQETADAALWGPLTPSAPHNGTTTSRAAAKAVAGHADADRWRILQFIVDRADLGATRDEIVIYFNLTDRPMGGDTVRPRVWECMDAEAVLARYGVNDVLIRESGETRRTQRGRKAHVLVATAAGIQVAREHWRMAA